MTDWRSRILSAIGRPMGLFVGLDFDGTLAPIRENPDAPAIDPECRDAIRSLRSHPNVNIGIISGRQLEDLVDRVGMDGLIYAGNHGLEIVSNGMNFVHPSVHSHRRRIDEMRRGFSEDLADFPGVVIEDKEYTMTINYRQCSSGNVEEIREVVDENLEDSIPEFQRSRGRKIIEIRPDIDWNKGSVMALIATTRPRGWIPIYLGDDTTDEDAFERIQQDGIGIHVGNRTETNASHRIPSQSDVATFLRALEPEVLPDRPDRTDT